MLDRYRFISVRWLVRWTPLFVLLLGAYWRIHDLGEQSFWNDEGNSLSLIQRDPDSLLDAVRVDIHPPGYYLVLKYWTALAGRNEIGLRSLSAFWGLLAIAGTYALGARLYARAAGILAALLVAINPLAVYYSQEARMYAQLGALSVLGLWVLTLWVIPQKKGRGRFVNPSLGQIRGIGIFLFLVNTLGLYTHYTYPFTILVQGIFFLWWWMSIRTKNPAALQMLGIYILVNAITLLLFAPWMSTAYHQLTTWPADDTGTALSEKLTTILTYITFGNSASGLGVFSFLWIGLLFLAFLLPDWYPQPPLHWWRVGLPLVWIGMVCGALLFLGAYREANLKFLLPAQMGVALLVGRGAYLLWDTGSSSAATPLEMLPRYGAGFAFFMVVSSTYGWLNTLQSSPDFERDDYRAIAHSIMAQSNAQDAVILNAPGQSDVFNYYFQGDATVYPLPRGYGGDDAATEAETLAIIQQHPLIFVVFWGEGERDPHGIVQKTLDSHAFEINSYWYGDVRLVKYGVLAPPPEQPTTPLEVRFGENIILEGYALQGELAQGLVGVTLFWHTDAPLEARYKVFVQVLDQAGRLVGQHDSEPANNLQMTPTWEVGKTVIDNHGVAVDNVHAGDYQIVVGLYELDHPKVRLPVQNGEMLLLERVTIP